MRPDREFMHEPNDEDCMVLVPYPFVQLRIERNEDGEASALIFTVFDEVQGRLVRDEAGAAEGD